MFLCVDVAGWNVPQIGRPQHSCGAAPQVSCSKNVIDRPANQCCRRVMHRIPHKLHVDLLCAPANGIDTVILGRELCDSYYLKICS